MSLIKAKMDSSLDEYRKTGKMGFLAKKIEEKNNLKVGGPKPPKVEINKPRKTK